jgi:hypothetical protein
MAYLQSPLRRRQLLLSVMLRSPDVSPIRRRLPYWLRILCVTPVLIGAVSGLMLALTPQLHEVYRGLVDTMDVARALVGLATVLLLGALLFCWNRDLNRLKIDQLYPNHADLLIDRHLFTLRHWKSLFCAVLPSLGLLAGLFYTFRHVSVEADLFKAVTERVGAAGLDGMPLQLAMMDRLATGLAIGMAVTAVATGVILALLWVARTGNGLGRVIYVIAGVGASFIALGPFLRSGAPSIQASVALGSLATVSLLIIGVTCILIVLSRLSRRLGVPLIGIVLVVTAYFTLMTLSSNVSGDETDNATGGIEIKAQAGTLKLTETFDAWLKSREDRLAYGSKPYPAFVYAIQGGGIYAASAGAAYLATVQDHCPAMTQHIFAVSAVSGGSMGAAVYQAMASGQRQVVNKSEPSCGEAVTVPMLPRIERVMQQDHLSPLLSFVITDQLRKLDYFALGNRIGLSNLTPDRAEALETSFVQALDRDLAAFPVNDYMSSGESNRLKQPYERSWAPIFAAPALLLNATSVEAGYRVTFSPFGLREAGDGTLFAFSEIDSSPAVRGQRLIQAAGVSARIPGIVPPWTIFHADEDGRQRSWNFVDGGYADGSGASTGFDMYRLLKQHIRDKGLNVDLRLVLLTDSVAAPRFEDMDGGTLGDAIVTVSTLMQMRRLLSVRAVTEAVTEARRPEPGEPADIAAGRVFVSHLEHKTFPLTLGWRISPSTDSIVRLLIGRPDLFPESQCNDLRRTAIPDARTLGGERDVKIARAAETIRTNSCAMQRMIRLVAGQ